MVEVIEGEKLYNHRVEGISYYTPKQPARVGSARADNEKEIPLLFKPLKIRGLELQNRITVSPMVQYSAEDGKVNPWHLQNYGAYATRGPGYIVAEATAVTKESRASPQDAGIWNDELAKAWAPIVEFVHSQQQLIGIQLGSSGRKSSTVALFLSFQKGASVEEGGWPDEVYGPSPISFSPGKLFTPKELDKEGIKYNVEAFAKLAKRAVEISKFDFIEIHGAHGYLIHEFLSGISNKRTDEYGGSLENRSRFLVEVIDAIRAVIPEDMPLFVRLSASENASDNPTGALEIEEIKRIADIIIPHGIDVIDVSSGGNYSNQHRRGLGEGMHVDLAAPLKKHVGDRAIVSVVGGFKHAEFANSVLEEGKADIIAVGRAFINNPGLVYKWAEDLDVKIHRTLQHF